MKKKLLKALDKMKCDNVIEAKGYYRAKSEIMALVLKM